MYSNMSNNDSNRKLWKVINMLLVLSHGQATIEIDFSTYWHVETQKLLRILYNLWPPNTCWWYCIQNVEVCNKRLVLASAAAPQKCMAYLDNLKTRKPSCRWQTRAMPAKSLHGVRKSSGVVVSCIASLLIDSVPVVYYYVLYSNCVALEILAF